MAKKKITLEALRLESFATELEQEQLGQVRGGQLYIFGSRYTYRTRWTSVDTRSDEAADQRFGKNGR
ncbi:MAG: pinensin family lanthipeptide [Saprospiraceae bacterium]